MARPMAQIAFIGLGKMGTPMAGRLLQAGHTLHVFTRSRGPVDALAKQGALPAGSATEAAARAEIILTALPTQETVEQVYEQLPAPARARQIYAAHSAGGRGPPPP